jgi:hypothetical protein
MCLSSRSLKCLPSQMSPTEEHISSISILKVPQTSLLRPLIYYKTFSSMMAGILSRLINGAPAIVPQDFPALRTRRRKMRMLCLPIRLKTFLELSMVPSLQPMPISKRTSKRCLPLWRSLAKGVRITLKDSFRKFCQIFFPFANFFLLFDTLHILL